MNHETRFKRAEEALAALEKHQRDDDDRGDPETARLVSAVRSTIRGDRQLRGEPTWDRQCDEAEINLRQLVEEQGIEAARIWALAMAYQLRADRIAAGILENNRKLTPQQSFGAMRTGIAIGMMRKIERRTGPGMRVRPAE